MAPKCSTLTVFCPIYRSIRFPQKILDFLFGNGQFPPFQYPVSGIAHESQGRFEIVCIDQFIDLFVQRSKIYHGFIGFMVLNMVHGYISNRITRTGSFHLSIFGTYIWRRPPSVR